MRKCSHCGLHGHNSRTCGGRGCVKLFGVDIRRSLSTGDLDRYVGNSNTGHVEQEGYGSDENNVGKERKKGKPWTEEEHRKFITGLIKQGKGDWRGISRNFVPTKTSKQVASHAQKYFMRRQASAERRKRRPSVFDMDLQKSKNSADQITSQFPHLSMENTPTSSAKQPELPYYMTTRDMVRAAVGSTSCMKEDPFLPYNNGGIGKLSPGATVHPNPTFRKPPIFRPSSSTSERPDSLELELKVG